MVKLWGEVVNIRLTACQLLPSHAVEIKADVGFFRPRQTFAVFESCAYQMPPFVSELHPLQRTFFALLTEAHKMPVSLLSLLKLNTPQERHILKTPLAVVLLPTPPDSRRPGLWQGFAGYRQAAAPNL